MKGRFPDIKVILLGVAAASGVTLFASNQAYASNMSDISGNGMHLTVSGDGSGLSTQVYENTEVNQTKSTSATIISKSGPAAGSTTPNLPASDSGAVEASAVREEASQDATKGEEGYESTAMSQSSEAALLGMGEKVGGAPPVMAQRLAMAGAEPLFEDRAVSDRTVTAGVGGQSLKLRLQPVITNNPVIIKDLAAALPTAPARKHVPKDPNGLLGRLTMSMPAVVPAMTEVQPAMGWPEAIYADRENLIFVGLLTVMFVVSFFAAWLQRAGFVGAARSDVSALKNNLAALFQSDYDLAKGHSPFLMMLKGRGIVNVVNV